jgi:L-methionine (R)-S-oxide reductase
MGLFFSCGNSPQHGRARSFWETITLVLPASGKVLGCNGERRYIEPMPHKYLLKEFEEFARSAAEPDAMMQRISQRVHLHIPRYNWVGFYLVDKNDSSALVLGPHTGSFIPKAKISWNEGLCGAAAATRRVTVADNVAEDPRYIQASDLVKSQISVPITAGNSTLAVFNVESYFLAAFKATQEREFLDACAKILSRCFARTVATDMVHA